MKRVYMAIPSTGQREDFHTYVFEQLRERYAGEVEMVFPDGCQQYFGHDYARNMYVERFLETDCDVLFFLDSDVCPPPHIFDLITMHWDKWQAAGAPYPLWLYPPGQQELSVMFTAYKGVNKDENGNIKSLNMCKVPRSGTEFVDGLATGCMFIKREVFEKLERPYFEFKRDPKTMEVKEGEDLGFCLKLHKLGIQFFCDHSMVCKHYKRVDLLEMNNYAVSMANAQVEAYQKNVQAEFEEGIRQAAAQGYRKGREDGLKGQGSKILMTPKRTESGLILPT